MPSPTYLLCEKFVRQNVAHGNSAKSSDISLTFVAIDPERPLSEPERGPLLTPEGSFTIHFQQLRKDGPFPEERASDFVLGKLYRVTPVEP